MEIRPTTLFYREFWAGGPVRFISEEMLPFFPGKVAVGAPAGLLLPGGQVNIPLQDPAIIMDCNDCIPVGTESQ